MTVAASLAGAQLHCHFEDESIDLADAVTGAMLK
jgi:hypothetical protein